MVTLNSMSQIQMLYVSINVRLEKHLLTFLTSSTSRNTQEIGRIYDYYEG
jgi:hypothetical protein